MRGLGKRGSWFLLAIGALALPSLASAQPGRDRAVFGSDLRIAAGEVVNDAVAFGGDVIVEGEVRGSATAFGGSVRLENAGRVLGDIVSYGGEVSGHTGVYDDVPQRAPAAVEDRTADGISHDDVFDWIADVARSAVAHVLLFLLGLLLMGLGRERLAALQIVIIRDGLKTAGTGLLAYVAAVFALFVLAISVVGIPIAVVLALALPAGTYVGLAAAASVLGAALPVPALRGREVLQLAAGVAVLFVCSQVPLIGTAATIAAACLGFGALIRTRFAKWPPRDLPEGDGPYRTAAPV